MIKLQNNYTTPEQSKKLLEIGVPADSADCYYTSQTAISHGENGTIFYHPKWFEYNDTYSKLKSQFPLTDYLIPCWSVGRLIEIITICREEIYTRLLFSRIDDHSNIENLIHYISAEIENGHMDFSKLEE